MPKRWIDYILAHPNNDWDWYQISINPNVEFEDIEAHPECPWDYYSLIANPNITWKIIIANMDRPWHISSLSGHRELDFEFVLLNPTLDWDWYYISKNPRITWDMYKKNKYWNHPEKTKKYIPWSLAGLSQNPNITMDIIEANFKLNWSFERISCNPNLTLEFIEKHLDKKWNYYILSTHKVITIDFINKHLDLPWHSSLGENPNITMEIIRANPHINWAPEYVSCNPNVTMKVVKDNISWFQFNNYSLANNPNITNKDIFENPDIFQESRGTGIQSYFKNNELTWLEFTQIGSEYQKYRSVGEISISPNVTWEIVEQNPVIGKMPWDNSEITWNYRMLSSNTMSEPIRKRCQARCSLLKQELLDTVFHPNYIQMKIEKYGHNAVVNNI